MKTFNHTFTGATAVRLSVCAAIAAVALSSCTQEDPPPPAEKEPDPVAVTGLSLDKTVLGIAKEHSMILTATVLPENATDKSVSWASNDESIVTVDSATGEMTAVDYGRATIIASAGDITDSCRVYVNQPAVVVAGGSDLGWFLGADSTLVIRVMSFTKTNTTGWSPWCDYVKAVKRAIIYRGTTSILFYTFEGCSNLTDFVIPDTVTSILDYAFAGSGFSGTIPAGVRHIGAYAFAGSRMTGNLVIPEAITRINERTFSGCTGLTSITIPSGVTDIRDSAFMNCDNVSSVTCYATTPPSLGEMNFGILRFSPYVETSLGAKLYVPAGSVEAYKATKWGRTWGLNDSPLFQSIEAIPE